jgi:prophage regulatory protein
MAGRNSAARCTSPPKKKANSPELAKHAEASAYLISIAATTVRHKEIRKMPEDELLERIMRLPEVERASGLGKSMIYEKEKKGEFPKRVHPSRRTSGWLESEVQAWIRSLHARGDAGKGNA